jgi:hypothetical protein
VLLFGPFLGLNWAKKPTIDILSLCHIIFQAAAVGTFLFCAFFLNTKTVFSSIFSSNSINFYAILSASYVPFVISIYLHVLNFILALP